MTQKTPETWCPPESESGSGSGPGKFPADGTGWPGSGTGPGSGPTGYKPVDVSTLCSLGWRPIMLTGLFRDILTRHFQTPMGSDPNRASNVEEKDLRHLVWRPDERTDILIESIYRWRGSLAGKLPAIVIKMNGRQNVRLMIDDSAGSTGQGHRQFQTFWAGSHTLFCLHGSGASAEILGTEVQRELTQFATALVQGLGLRRLQVTEVGAVVSVEEAKESYCSPVTVGWTYSEQWNLEYESRVLRKVSIGDLLYDVIR